MNIYIRYLIIDTTVGVVLRRAEFRLLNLIGCIRSANYEKKRYRFPTKVRYSLVFQ